MSDIRLASVTIDPTVPSLSIRNGTVKILSTKSSNSLDSALTVYGGLSIQSTSNAINLTTGGSITSLGGMSILKDLRIGGSTILDSVSGEFRIGGISNSRFFVDTITNKQISFAPDGQTNSLIIRDQYIEFLPILSSGSISSGSVILSGGLSIRNSTDATSFTAGGGITIGGGAAVRKNLFVGETVHGNSFLSDTAYDISGPGSQPIGGLELQDNGGVGIYSSSVSYFTAPGFRFWNGNTSGIFLTIFSTGSSFSTDLSISGKTSLLNTVDSTTTSTGSMILSGGLGVTKSVIVGNLIGISPSTDNLIKLNLFGSLTNSNAFTGLGTLNSGSLKIQINSTGNDVIFSASTSELLRIKGSTKELLIGGNSSSGSVQSYSLRNGGYSANDISLTGMFPGSSSSLNLYSADGNGTTSVNFKLFNKGTYSSITNNEWIELGTDNTNYYLTSKQTGTGLLRNLVLGDNLTISKQNSDITINSTKISTNSSTAGLVVSGGVSIRSTAHSSSVTAGGALTIAGGSSIAKDLYVGGNQNLTGNLTAAKVILGTSELFNSVNTLVLDTSQLSIVSTSANISDTTITSGSYNSEFKVYGMGSISSINSEWLELGTNNSSTGFSIITKGAGTGLSRPLNLGSAITLTGSSTSLLGTLTVSQQTTFGNGVVINGNLEIGSNGNLLLGTNTSITTGALRLTSTVDSTTTSTGTLIVSGGVGVAKTVRVGDSFYLKNSSLTSNGDDLFVNANGSSIYLRTTPGSNTNELIMNVSTGSIGIFSSIESTNGSTGALAVIGGLAVAKRAIISGGITAGSSSFTSISSQNVLLTNSSIATLRVSGNSTIGTNLLVNGTSNLIGIVSVLNTTESIDSSTGGLIISGGVGVRKNLCVGGDTILTGNLTVNGTTTTINSQNQLLKDNIFILNSGPIGSRDSGFIIQRFQTANDSNSGDVVADSPEETYTIGLQSGATNSQIILPSGANSTNNYYNNWWIKIGSGFSSGQVRQISGYTGSTRLAQLSSSFTSQNPANGDTVYLYNKPFVGLVYRESSDLFSFTGMINDTSVASTGLLGIEASNIICSKVTTGSLIVTNTTESSNIGTGAVILSGGLAINKSVNIGGDLSANGVNMTPNYGDIQKPQTFIGSQNVTNASVTGLQFDTTYVGAFDIYLMVRITATINRYAHYHMRGIWKGGGSFEVVSGYVGDDLGISFDITSSGQITYSAPSYSGFTGMTMKYRAYTL